MNWKTRTRIRKICWPSTATKYPCSTSTSNVVWNCYRVRACSGSSTSSIECRSCKRSKSFRYHTAVRQTLMATAILLGPQASVSRWTTSFKLNRGCPSRWSKLKNRSIQCLIVRNVLYSSKSQYKPHAKIKIWPFKRKKRQETRLSSQHLRARPG